MHTSKINLMEVGYKLGAWRVSGLGMRKRGKISLAERAEGSRGGEGDDVGSGIRNSLRLLHG